MKPSLLTPAILKPLVTVTLPLLAAFFLIAPELRAEEEENPQEVAQELVELGRPLVESGSYFDAIRKLRKAVKSDPANVDAVLLLSEAYEHSGKPGKAQEVVEALGSNGASVNARTRLAELMLLRGDPRAEKLLQTILSADKDAMPARRMLGTLFEDTGRREEALAAYIAVNKSWGRLQKKATADDDLAEARARLGIYRLSDEYQPDLMSVRERLQDALKKEPRRTDLRVEAGNLFMRFADGGMDWKAKKQYGKALELNPQYAPAIYGLAWQLAFRFDDVKARREAERALRANGAHIDSLLFLAQMDLGDGRYEPAQKRITAALEVNPIHPEARATRAALEYLRGDHDGYEKEVSAILERDRFASEAYAVLAGICEEQRRFQEAYELAAKAVNVDGRDWDSQFLAGRNAMNVGADELAAEYLKRSEDGDVFENIYRANFLKLFDKMRAYPARKDDRFVVRLPAREDSPYYPLLRRTLDWSLDLLEQRWSFELEDPTYISVFDKQQDFAARTVGLPGFPALGACFGRAVTLDSPRALPPGQFGWRATLHHELAHCITLQLSKGRVPRWLTEGASVYEERKVSPLWNREMERVLVDAIASDEVLGLDVINGAFRGPKVLFAYYQGGLMCEFIERDFGFPALREMVRLYGEDKHTPQVVKEALGVSTEAFDERFLAYAKEYVAELGVLGRPSNAKMARLKRHLRKQKQDGEAWILYATGHTARGDKAAALAALAEAVKTLPEDGRIPALRALIAAGDRSSANAVKHAEKALAKGTDLFRLRMILARFYETEEKDLQAAEEHYRRAIALFPYVKGPGDPRIKLADLVLESGGEARLAEHIQLLRDHTDMDEDDWTTRMLLIELYETRSDGDQQLAVREQVRDICPLPNANFTRTVAAQNHARLAELYTERERHADAELACRLAVAVARMDAGDGAQDPFTGAELSDLLVRHAEALRALGKLEEALQALRDALREDPANEDALELQRRLQQ